MKIFSLILIIKGELNVNIQDLDFQTQEKIKNLSFNSKKPKKDITGKVYGRLTVLGRGEDYVSSGGKRASQWWCICDCSEHNLVLVRLSNLTSGNTKSCGCLDKEKSAERIRQVGYSMARNIAGEVFGELTAIKATNERKNGSVVWECQCSCGKSYLASSHDLIHHRVESCGHTKESKGVRKIRNILDMNNIPYTMEKTFKDCKFPDSNGVARFDFFINNEFLLEYDGEQHFLELDNNFFRDSLEKRKYHDQYKNQWCKEHNILLKRIPYFAINDISLETIMGDTFLT